MASAVTHAVVALALGKTFTRKEKPSKFWLFSVFCSILPDADVLSFFFGWRYGDILGHRGFSHSVFFAFLLSLLVLFSGFKEVPKFSKSWWFLGLFFFLLTATHGFLDALTNGGLGIAFFSPFMETRYFLPWKPLIVSPLGLGGFFSPWGKEVILSEISWVWLPSVLLLVAVRIGQKIISFRKKTAGCRWVAG